MLEEVDDFAHFAFCVLVAGDVGEARGGLLLVVDLGLRAAESHDPAGELAAGAATQPHEDPDEEQEREQREQIRQEAGGRADTGDRDVVRLERRSERRVLERERDLAREVVAVLQLARDATVRIDGRRAHLARVDLGQELGVVVRVRRRTRHPRPEEQEHRGQQADHQQPPPRPGRWWRDRRRLAIAGRPRIGGAREVAMLHGFSTLCAVRPERNAVLLLLAPGRLALCRST